MRTARRFAEEDSTGDPKEDWEKGGPWRFRIRLPLFSDPASGGGGCLAAAHFVHQKRPPGVNPAAEGALFWEFFWEGIEFWRSLPLRQAGGDWGDWGGGGTGEAGGTARERNSIPGN
jgi:hypothetical protein